MLGNLYEVASTLAHPFTLVATAVIVLLVMLSRQRVISHRGVRILSATLGAALYLLASPLVAIWSTQSLEGLVPRVTHQELETARAIVVLAGGFRRGPGGRGELALDTVSRCLHAATVYRALGSRPVVVSGGLLASGPANIPVARGMRDFLVELGVAGSDIIEEGRSSTTYENAAETRRLLAEKGLDRIALVTSSTHLPRSTAVFEGQGFTVIPAGSGYSNQDAPWRAVDLLPSASAADAVNRVAHEWVGLAWYRLRGRL